MARGGSLASHGVTTRSLVEATAAGRAQLPRAWEILDSTNFFKVLGFTLRVFRFFFPPLFACWPESLIFLELDVPLQRRQPCG